MGRPPEVQTIPDSGMNFTLARATNVVCLYVLSVATTPGAQNWSALYHAIRTQGGTSITGV